MGILPSTCCLFNCGDTETVNHLFFTCPYTQHILNKIRSKCNIHRHILAWPEEVQWMDYHARCNKLPQTIRNRMERYRISLKNCFLPPESIIHKIQGDVAAKMAGNEIFLDHLDEHNHSLGVN
ncbi:hypothetical protein CFOL_v3_28924 [Cephalotus follicularis]|uniref:Zf-RVT domain-containing protein n=1 Tax=Cephalotus follicularis TaxID=3775 RepID=A0A1Q3CZI0_CEPFO|nr:hypothetical protein CFOL_v3_28924 [Cephalotus follicularis]